MRQRHFTRSLTAVAAASTAVLLLGGCGSVSVSSKDDGRSASAGSSDTPTPSPSATATVDTTAAAGNWLLGMSSAGGADGETSTTTYITYNPATGASSAIKMPGVKTATASPEEQSLLVSTDRRWAIPDTVIPRAEEKSGQLTVYSLADGGTEVIDIRKRTGQDVGAIGWAFDPKRPDTLRVVDTANRVWALSVSGTRATREGSLPKGPWVFTNGFNRNTGEPYVSSIESEETKPAGNGTADTSPVSRAGGTVLPASSAGFEDLPASPCRLGAGFTDADGVTWEFCADKPTVSSYYLAKDGQEWTAYGKPSTAVAPIAADFTLVLPPAA
jgi:hypothetical protein